MGSTAGSISPSPSSGAAFPSWLRRLDPFLEAADTNAPFEAFRVRRASGRAVGWLVPRSRAAWRRAAVRVGAWIFSIVWLGFVVLMVLHQGPGPDVSSLAILLIALQFALRRLRKGGSLPEYLLDLIRDARKETQGAFDLWMTGASAREVAVGLYLESRERTWKAELTVAFLFVTVGMGVLVYWRGYDYWRTSTLVVAAIFLWWQLFAYSTASAGCGALQMVLYKWRGEMQGLSKQVARAVLIVAVSIPVGILALLLIGMAGAPLALLWQALDPWRRLLPLELHLAILVTLLGALLRMYRAQVYRSKLRRFDKLATEFTGRYDRYMGRFIARDPAMEE